MIYYSYNAENLHGIGTDHPSKSTEGFRLTIAAHCSLTGGHVGLNLRHFLYTGRCDSRAGVWMIGTGHHHHHHIIINAPSGQRLPDVPTLIVCMRCWAQGRTHLRDARTDLLARPVNPAGARPDHSLPDTCGSVKRRSVDYLERCSNAKWNVWSATDAGGAASIPGKPRAVVCRRRCRRRRA